MRRKTARKLEIKLLICFLMISIITVGFSSFKAAFSFIGDITIIGAPRTVTVTYDANGGTILNNSSATITVDYAIGDQYGAFPDVERPGYTLLGWYYNGEQITHYTTIDSDNHTVTAEWEIDEIRYIVYLEAGEHGWFSDPSDQYVETEQEYTYLTIPQNYSEYTFIGYYNESHELVTDNTGYVTRPMSELNGQTLTAEWDYADPGMGSEMYVTLDAGPEGYFYYEGYESSTINYLLGYTFDSDTFESTLPTPYSYNPENVFRGWNTSYGSYISEMDISSYTKGELNGQYLTASWENMSGYEPGPGEGEISITFNLNDTPFVMSDDTGMETQWYEYRTDYSSTSLPIPYDPTSSYNFTGWYSEMNGGQVTDEYGMPLYGDISSLNGTTLTPIYE